jgi:hypothetical protein
MTTPPNRQPEGIPSGGQFAPSAHAEPDVTLAQATPVPAITASVDLQQWQNDYAVTFETVEYDAGPILARMSPEERAEVEDYSETADELYFEAVRRGLVKDHAGPFGLSVRAAMDEAEEQDPGVWDKIAEVPQARKPDAVLETALTPFEIGARAGSDGWVEGLATFEMDDLIGNDLDGHGDQIGFKLVGSELLMDVSARPVSVTPEGSIICRLSGDASAIIDGFDEDELAAYEAGRAEATPTD